MTNQKNTQYRKAARYAALMLNGNQAEMQATAEAIVSREGSASAVAICMEASKLTDEVRAERALYAHQA